MDILFEVCWEGGEREREKEKNQCPFEMAFFASKIDGCPTLVLSHG